MQCNEISWKKQPNTSNIIKYVQNSRSTSSPYDFLFDVKWKNHEKHTQTHEDEEHKLER